MSTIDELGFTNIKIKTHKPELQWDHIEIPSRKLRFGGIRLPTTDVLPNPCGGLWM